MITILGGRGDKLWLATAVLIVVLATAALSATNGTVQINTGGSATYKVTYSGATITPNAEPPSLPTNFRFFSGTGAPDPTAPSGFSPTPTATKPDSSTYKYDLLGAGSVVTVLADNSTNYGWSSTGYTFYAGSYHNETITLSGTDPKTYEMNFSLTYQKAAPYAPTIDVQESQVRVGETSETKTTLVVTVTPNLGTAPNQREVRGGSPSNYALRVVRQGDSAPITTVTSGSDITGPVLINQSGGTFTITGTYLQAGQRYNLTAFGRNWYGNGAETPRTWELLGGGVGGPQTHLLTLESKVSTGGPGINSFALPFAGPWYDGTGATVTNAYELVLAINRAAGSNVVSTFGKWDKTAQVLGGVVIPGNDPTVPAVQTALQAITLEQGVGYQVYVTNGATVTIKNTP